MSDIKQGADGRPYTICHIFMTIDGRIDGAFMGDPAAAGARGAYARLQGSFEADAIAYGSTTLKGFIGSSRPKLPAVFEVPDGDYVAPHRETSYLVALDPAGELAWKTATYRRAGRPDAHVVALLSGSTPASYRAYLRGHGVSYVVAGADELDLQAALVKLRALFGIERMLVCGGGVADAAFLAAGVLDVVSVVVAPVVSGERGVATLFDEVPFARLDTPTACSLERVELVDGGGLHAVYRVR